jgi:hypothetical protein
MVNSHIYGDAFLEVGDSWYAKIDLQPTFGDMGATPHTPHTCDCHDCVACGGTLKREASATTPATIEDDPGDDYVDDDDSANPYEIEDFGQDSWSSGDGN